MSIRASAYARSICETTPELKLGARCVLMLAAERANTQTAITYTGGWLVRATGLHRSSVRRCLYELVALGVVALEWRAGKASLIRFPIASALSTPGAPARLVDGPDLAHQRALPGAPARATWREGARRTELEPGNYPAVTCGCGTCDSGWLFVEVAGERGYVTPCPGRSALDEGMPDERSA